MKTEGMEGQEGKEGDRLCCAWKTRGLEKFGHLAGDDSFSDGGMAI